MNIIPFVHEGLGNSSYLVGFGDHSAALVDPDRNVQRYLEAASANSWRITHVFETHLHADFVTGSLEVRQATGAELFVPEGSQVRYPHRPVAPGDAWPVPFGRVESIPSAGHTPEHTSYVLHAPGAASALFSGGSLLVAGAARTDLISPEATDALTRAQYRSITTAFRGLPDETLLLPTHGGGSFCSTGAGGERTSTLGHVRRTNPLLGESSEDAFARTFPASFPAAPSYFFRLRAVNQAGQALRSSIAEPPYLAPGDFDTRRASAVVIDVRPQADFMAGHIPGAVSNTLRDAFSTWLGWVIPADEELLFVLGDEPLADVIDACLLVGYERFAGVLEGGMSAWAVSGREVARDTLADASESRRALAAGALALDVREPNEFAEGHLPGALNIPLGELQQRVQELPRNRSIVTYCGHGERSATGLSLLRREGFGPLTNLNGGTGAWKDAGLPLD